MNEKKKFSFSMILLSLSFFMMIDTKYHHALGDYILEFIGLNSWTGNYAGFHLTNIYFGILFFIFLYLVKKYGKQIKSMTSMRIFIIFIVLVTSMASISSYTAKNYKIHSDGLNTIAYLSEESQLEYRSIETEITKFNAYFTLKNYSEDSRNFYISIDSPWARKQNFPPIEIYNLDGTRANFRLEGQEEKTFQINLKDYKIDGGKPFNNGGFKGNFNELVLSSVDEKIYLEQDEFLNLEIKK